MRGGDIDTTTVGSRADRPGMDQHKPEGLVQVGVSLISFETGRF